MTAIHLNLEPFTDKLTHEQFYQLCMANKDVQMERSPEGKLIIIPPVGGNSGQREARYIAKLFVWNEQSGLGIVFSSSTVFKLPGGGDRSPDAAWTTKEHWNALAAEDRKKCPPICPDFVIELRSESDRLKPLQDKMQEYLKSGLRLGWLINPQDQQVEIYRKRQPIEVKALPCDLSGESILPGFVISIDLFEGCESDRLNFSRNPPSGSVGVSQLWEC